MKAMTALSCALLLLSFTPGCELMEMLEPTPPEPPLADCVVTELTKVDAGPGEPAKVILVVLNRSSDVAASGVSCELKVKSGNTILERTWVWVGDLEPGESAVENVWLSSIKSHSEYSVLEYELTWY